MRRWIVKCSINLDASKEVNVIVIANTERNARSKAIKECEKKGYFLPHIISCENCDYKKGGEGDGIH